MNKHLPRELIRPHTFPVIVQKPLRAKGFRIGPDLLIRQDGLHKRQDDSVLGDEVATEHHIL